MKTEDFERLKAICEKEGFELELSSPWDQTYKINKKDPWEGVEFVEDKDGNVYRFIEVNSFVHTVTFYDKDELVTTNSWGKYKPSTEEAYVEQLKKEAFERFGAIKKRDKFNTGYGIHSIIETHPEWRYNKNIDFLYYKGLIVYSKGEWAERVKERIEVDMWSIEHNGAKTIRFNFDLNVNSEKIQFKKTGEFLATQLEKYLNGEIND